jgi:hypothetical protein
MTWFAETAAWPGFLQRMEEKYPEFCFDPKALRELIDVKYRRARLVLRAGYERAVTLLAWSPAIRALAGHRSTEHYPGNDVAGFRATVKAVILGFGGAPASCQ